MNDFLENRVIASEVEIKLNLNKSMTHDYYLDWKKNATKEKETYFELKFKLALKLAEIDNMNFDQINNLIFQKDIVDKIKN